MAPLKSKHADNEPSDGENRRTKTKRKTYRYCCVKNCHNNEGLRHVKLHRFPSQPWDKELRKKWISAVRRVNTDGSEWVPNSSSRICSEHFVNNAKSNIAAHPTYLPTLFPAVYKSSVIPQDQASRFDRWHHRVASRQASSLGGPASSLTGIPSTSRERTSSGSRGGNEGLHLLCTAVEFREERQPSVVRLLHQQVSNVTLGFVRPKKIRLMTRRLAQQMGSSRTKHQGLTGKVSK
ncbi:uncharacterized protein LOC115330669 [Ixodes scapularis]|uniref:uncharacterized protein LOC115330669 n=1 Tax=Ixodes scapularis TaxID=6945 RepID=UPI001C394108|nr:uncharacterized protein LOC115330669 [Ixodes scapularis]